MANGSGIVLTDDTDSVFNLSGGTFNMTGAGYINAALGTFNVSENAAIHVTPTALDAAAGKKIVGIFRDETTAQQVLAKTTMADGWTAGVVTANNQTMILAGQGSVPEGIKIWKPGTTGAMSDEANWDGTTTDATGYVFSGTNKFTSLSGNLIVNGGSNTINSPSTATDPLINAGQMLVYNGGDNTLGSADVTSKGSIYVNDGRVKTNNNLRIYGTESNVAYLEVNGTLTATRWLAIAQGASENCTAKVVINNGIVYCGNKNGGGLIVCDGDGSNGELVLNGGTLQINNNQPSSFPNTNSSTAKFTMTGGTYTTGGAINIATKTSSKATVDISGGELNSTGTISIGTGSSAKGALTISGGEVTANRVQVGRKSAGDDAKVTITGGKLIVTQDICGSSSSASGCIYVSGSGQIVFDSTFTSSAGIRELTRFQIAGAGDGTGALRFLKSLECKSAITLTDDTTIGIDPGATFTQSAAIAQTQASGLTITGGGTLALSVASSFTGGTTIDSSAVILSGAGTLGTGNITLNDASLTFNGVTSSIASNISGTGDLTVSSGTATLTGTVTQTAGSTTLANGTALNFASGTLNDLAVAGEGASAALNVTGDLTLNNDGNTKFIGPITAASITKTGEGTLKLNSGDGTITASNVTVTGGRLDLLGKATGGLTISGAVFSPGNSVGATTITNGGFTLSDDASVILEIGGATPDKNDSLVASGALNLDGGKIYLTFADACDLEPGDQFTAVFSGSNSESLKNRFIDDYVVSHYFTSLAYAPYGDGQFAITGILDPNAVPEPATWALLVLGAFGMMYFRKRK
ncbi:MAG: PEP-CTERM sorting domain-containing protein [Thermoguttaceae bacterium]|nr:PEP-CTERM sorting domain-containing protein [Thermoguttaceae bacterium]